MDAVRTRLSGPVIGCADAFELAEFYASLLGWTVVARSEKAPGVWALVRSPAREHKIEFQREDPFVPPVWPTVAGEQQMGMHLDIGVEVASWDEGPAAMRAGIDFAVSLGARLAEHQPQAERGVIVLLDPAGHPFCLFPTLVKDGAAS